MVDLIMSFVEAMHRETGRYPTEIVLPLGPWMQMHSWAEKICVYEEPTEARGGAIVLAQGTKIRLATDNQSNGDGS